MKSALSAITIAAFAAAASPASAQVAAEANVAKVEGEWGTELGAGYSVLSLGGFKVTPSVGVFLHDTSDDRFERVEAGGTNFCREVSTNQPADDDRCDQSGTQIYGRVEATFSIPLAAITAGAGARLSGDDRRPYATASMPLLPFVSLKGNVGREYIAAGLSARF